MTETALKVSGLKKVYDGGVEALKGIDFEVEPGDFVAVLGPNGAGKSTTIGIISSLVNKSAGDVTIMGYDLETQAYDAKKQLGVVPQEFNFNQFEKVYNIVVTQAGYYGMPRKEAAKNAEKYLRKLGLWDKRDAISRELSGGMKRRLMIARALVHEPKILILDEPTAGVDIELRRSMWDFLREQNNQGTTIILTTHYLEEAEQLCEKIIIIDRGVIIQDANMKALLATLETQTMVFELTEPVQGKPLLEGFTSNWVDDTTLEVELNNGADVNSVFTELNNKGIKVAGMSNKVNRLEELFVSMVEGNL